MNTAIRTWAERKILFDRVKRMERKFGVKRFQAVLRRWYAWVDRQQWAK